MAIIEVKVPQLSESVSEATLLDWHKKEGEPVKRDENLIDIETDKVVLELPAPADGVLVKILRKAKDSVGSGDVIAQIDTEAKAGAAVQKEPPRKEAEKAKPASPAVMPAAQKIAAEKGIDTSKVQGTGRDGRVTKGDVLSQKPAEAAKAPLPQPAPPVNVESVLSGRPEQRVPMSRLRQRVAERLVMAQSTAAILTTFNEVNMAPVMEMRKKYQERFEKEHGTRLGFMSFFVKAAVHALKRFPLVNASIDGSDIVYHGYFDIGVAVGSPRGLVVPILRDADQMSFAEIEKKIGDFGKRAQDGKLGIEELTGGTFSISNGGVFGSMLSTPILNPPQSAILGVHATKERPVVENGQIVIRPMNYLALSYDHRIIDGREAVLFLVSIKDALEDPARLILEI
ncbi:MAG TPA: 2-oxoglutarate dehydrogenase complex dihydrolipoyllysine-residue succinyltransferase [Burkholderiales bacterium]|nr:2-oxoglutarate dehydrogenase complex dihydrolipoyllysine-residue succinyltransferase [Burkholderiales bacterium]